MVLVRRPSAIMRRSAFRSGHCGKHGTRSSSLRAGFEGLQLMERTGAHDTRCGKVQIRKWNFGATGLPVIAFILRR